MRRSVRSIQLSTMSIGPPGTAGRRRDRPLAQGRERPARERRGRDQRVQGGVPLGGALGASHARPCARSSVKPNRRKSVMRMGRGSRPGGRIHAARRRRGSRRPRRRPGCRRNRRPCSAIRAQRGTAARRPGMERQPSQRSTRSSPTGSTVGLITTVLPIVASSGCVAGACRVHAEHEQPQGTWTCGAASPAPGASSIVSIMSATRRRISGAPGSATGSARWSRTGLPMRAILRMAMMHHIGVAKGFGEGGMPCYSARLRRWNAGRNPLTRPYR